LPRKEECEAKPRFPAAASEAMLLISVEVDAILRCFGGMLSASILLHKTIGA